MHETSYGSVKVFWLDRDEAVRRLIVAAQELIQACPEVHRVVLFGSLAEGRAVPGSDADLIVVTDDDRRWLDRNLKYRPYLDGCGIGVDVFAYTPVEARTVSLAVSALERGKVLAERHSSA